MSVRYRFTPAHTPALRRLPFERMEKEGMARAVLWNRAAPCLPDWLECVDPAHALLWLAYDQNTALAGAVWLNPIMGLCGCVHFCIFKAARPDWKNLGRQAIAHLFQERPLAGLLAVWPAHYRYVTRAAKHWGFGKPVTLPKACPMPAMHKPSRCRDGFMAVLRREDFEKRFQNKQQGGH